MKPTVSQHKQLFQGDLLTWDQVYAKGMEDAHKNERVSLRSAATELADEVTKMILQPSREFMEKKAPKTWWPGFVRSAEHLVTDIDPASAATVHGVVPVNETVWPGGLTDTWVTSSMPFLQYTTMIESAPGQGIPTLPKVVRGAAGQQPGEKQLVPGTAYSIESDPGTEVEGSYYLNISQVVAEMGYGPLNSLVMKSEAAALFGKQIAQAVEAAATATNGFAHFTGRYQPSVVVVPPALLDSVNVTNYVNAGLKVVLDNNVTKVLIVSPDATIGWFRQGRMQAEDPSVYGYGLTFKFYGRLACDSAGIASMYSNPGTVCDSPRGYVFLN